jgi:hypothetical protein
MLVKASMATGLAKGTLLASAEHIPDGTALLEVVVIAHRDGCAILQSGPCDCKPPVGATSVGLAT